MNPAQAAQRTPGEEPAANFNPESAPMGEGRMGEEPMRDREGQHGELDEAEDFEAGELDEEEDIERMAIRVLSRARQRIRQQPLTAATGAFIVGFAFGNGVPKFLARAGVAIGLRMVMQRMFDRAELFEDDE